MAIHSEKNLYPGVNAHLNSFLQVESRFWRSFHGEHITDLRRTISRALPEGYVAVSELSLQITENPEPFSDAGRPQVRIPDLTIYQTTPPVTQSEYATASVTPIAVLPPEETIEVLDEEDLLSGIVIYKASDDEAIGRPVTRIELLSPSNKPGGEGYAQYELKKDENLRSGLRLIELDLLHHTRSVIPTLPRYNRRQLKAFPYTIIISDPRPTFEDGQAAVYGIGAIDPLPILSIPLEGVDTVRVDFQAAYNVTFENLGYRDVAVDYAEDPPAFDKFTPEDQEKIRAILTRVRDGQVTG